MRDVVAKHAVFSHESRASLSAPPGRELRGNVSRTAISTQGEIDSQELTPLDREKLPQPALPPGESARASGDPAQLALLAKIEELSEKVDALCARAQAEEDAVPSNSEKR